MRNHLAGFSPNMREVLERFRNVDLGPAALDNHAMGTVIEELIRTFNEALNENPFEHFTPGTWSPSSQACRDRRLVEGSLGRSCLGPQVARGVVAAGMGEAA